MNDKKQELILGMPDPTVSLEEKKKEWYGVQWAKYIDSQWNTKQSTYFKTRQAKMQKSRAYATGQQDIAKYKQWINDANETSWMAIDYEILPIIPKYVKLITDYVMGLPEKTKAEAIDPLSAVEREDYRKKLLFKKENKEFLREMEAVTGIKVDEEEFVPETMDDIKVYMAMKYKQSVVVAATKAINLVFQLNDYPDEIKRQIIEDIVVDGFGGTKTWTDPQYGVMTRRVDPMYAIYPQTKARDFSDITYGAEVYQMHIYELKRLTAGKFSDDQWREIAKNYSGRTASGYTENNSQYNAYTGEPIMDYETVKVDILDFAFKTPCKTYFKNKTTKYGKERYEETDKVSESDMFDEYDYETVFTGMYVMGSGDILFNYQQLDNVANKQGSIQKVELPFKFYMPSHYKNSNRSYVDMMIPSAEQVQLAHLKIQQMVSQAKPTGLTINLAGLEQISMGDGGELSPIQMKDIYDASGTYYYRSVDPETGQYVGDAPIRPLPNPIQNLPELINTFNFYIEQIRTTTGITMNMEGIIGNRQATATVESSINSSASAISDVAHAYKRITQRTADHIISAFQDIIEYGKDTEIYKYYRDAIGENDVKMLDALDNLPLRAFGITIEVDTEMREFMELEQSIQTALAARTLQIQDAMMVRKHAKVDIGFASELLELKVKENEERSLQMEMAKIQEQGNQIQQQQAMGVQLKQMEMAMELEMYKQKAAIDLMKEQQLKMIDAGIESKQSVQDFYEELQLKTLEATGKAGEIANQNQMAFAKIDKQKEAQKELIDKREQTKVKQNNSVTDMV